MLIVSVSVYVVINTFVRLDVLVLFGWTVRVETQPWTFAASRVRLLPRTPARPFIGGHMLGWPEATRPGCHRAARAVGIARPGARDLATPEARHIARR